MADNKKFIKPQPPHEGKSNFLQVPDDNIRTIATTNDLLVSGNKNKQQQQIQKKHSGPLDVALNELKQQEEAELLAAKEKSTKLSAKPTTTTLCHHVATSSQKKDHHHHHYPHAHLPHQRKRERWLLTRKTWKFMQDAGRKLLPENIHNRREDIPLIEAHFQDVCATETKFLLWRRKVSFPGARRSSLRNATVRSRRLPGLRRHQQQQQKNVSVEQTADVTMELLSKYLKLDDHTTTTTALLSSKTQQPHQTVSPSAQRPVQQQEQLSPTHVQQQQQKQQLEQLMMQLQALSSQAAALSAAASTLNDSMNWLPKPDMITRDLLENKNLLRQIYNALKRQQLHRQLSRHTTPTILLRRTHSFHNLYQPATTTKTLTRFEQRKQPPMDLKLKSTTTTGLNTTTNKKIAGYTEILGKKIKYKLPNQYLHSRWGCGGNFTEFRWSPGRAGAYGECRV